MYHLYELRKQKKLTQEICANLMGLQTTVYQRWEQGVYEPSWENAIMIANFFEVSLDYLAGLTNDPKRYYKK